MHKIRFISWVGLFLILSAFVRADACDPQWLNAVFTGNVPQSEWGKSEPIQGLNKSFSKLDFQHRSKNLLSKEAGALVSIDPEINHMSDDINFYQMNFDRLKKEYSFRYQKRLENQTIVNFYDSRFKIFESGLKEIEKRIARIDEARANSFVQSLSPRVRELKKFLSEIQIKRNQKLVEIRESRLDEFTAKMAGVLAEVAVFISLKDAKQVSFSLNRVPEFAAALRTTLQNLEEKWRKNPTSWFEFKQDYPLIFSRLKLSEYQKPEDYLFFRQLRFWLDSKDFDILLRDSDTLEYKILEVKRNNGAMTLSQFKEVRSDQSERTGKSLEVQMLENKEIFKLIGLRLEFWYLFTGGISVDLKNYLQIKGIHVLQSL